MLSRSAVKQEILPLAAHLSALREHLVALLDNNALKFDNGPRLIKEPDS
jgi:hypothetical protein